MIMGMDRLGCCRGPEQFRGLFKALCFRLLGKGEIFPVCLGLAGKGVLQVFL